MRIYYTREVRVYFSSLIDLLYEKNYFGFRQSAKEYVDTLVDEIKLTLPLKAKKIAPEYFKRYGKDLYYTGFRKNHSTIWYVFFTTHIKDGETIYLIHYISNNHVISQYL